MGNISYSKRTALEEAYKMALDKKPKKEIVAFLVSKYLFASMEAYNIANAGIYKAEHKDEYNKEVYDV